LDTLFFSKTQWWDGPRQRWPHRHSSIIFLACSASSSVSKYSIVVSGGQSETETHMVLFSRAEDVSNKYLIHLPDSPLCPLGFFNHRIRAARGTDPSRVPEP